MPDILLEYQLVIRDAANTTDAIVFSSVRGDSAPYIEGPPTCDGQEINPLTGEFRSGTYTGYIVDAITTGTSRAVTSQLEDATFRQQLAGRVAFWKERETKSGIVGAWTVVGAGFLTLLRLVSGSRWEFNISDATRVEDNALAFSPKQGALALTANALAGATSLSVSALPFAIAAGYRLYFTSGKLAVVAAAAAAGATALSVVGGTVTVAAPGAAALATTLPVNALTCAIPQDFTIVFASGKQVGVAAAAAIGATSLTVYSLDVGIAAGDSGTLCPALSSGDTAPISEAFASYFARWPNRGCVFGGPVTGGVLQIPDLGGWIVRAAENTAGGGENANRGTTWLPLFSVGGYVPPRFSRTVDARLLADIPNQSVTASNQYSAYPGFAYEFPKSFWPGLIYQIVPMSQQFTGVASEFYAPEDAAGFPSGVSMNGKGTNGIVDPGYHGSRRQGLFAMTQALAIGTTPLRIRGFTCLPSDTSKLYWSGHPIDLAKALLDEQQRLYDATSAETVRQTIGADRRVSIAIGSQLPKVNDILLNAVYAPFGIGVRMNSAGVLEFFCTRILSNSAPSTTITDADIQHDEQGSTGIQSWFELDESAAIRSLIFEYDEFFLIQQADKFPADGIATQHIRIELQNGDPGAVGSGVAAFSVPGMVHSKDTQMSRYQPQAADDTVRSWVNQLGYEVFTRWGRGGLAFELPFLRGGAGDALKLGDECINRIPQLPNKNKRYGDDNSVGGRAMQIVRRTPTPRGAMVKLVDSGVGLASVSTLPTLSLTASKIARLALRVPMLTVTNAATLNATSLGVEIQIAITTGAAPASTDYTAAGSYLWGAIPTAAFQLGYVVNGRTVWARARANQYGLRPSAWTTPISLALTALNPPSGLAVTPNAGDGTQALATWTPGANADQSAIDVYLRPSAQAANTAVLQQTLDAGAVQFNLEGLTPTASYTVGVQSRDLNYGDTSAMVEVTFTAGSVTPTLAAPLYPQWFVGGVGPDPNLPSRIARLLGANVPRADGSYGMAVYATVFPGFVEFFEAVETSVGSGTYGSFNSVGKVASVQGDWTKIDRTAPNDKLRRQLEAQHVRDNATSSGFTAIGTVSPWGTPIRLALPPFTRSVPTADDGGFTPIADGGYNLSSGILPGAGVVEGSSTFSIYRHREDINILGPDTDGDVAYSFALTYQNVPMIAFRGGQMVTFSNTIGTSVKQRTRIQVLNATASGFTSRAQICSVGTTTAQANDFASGNTITVAGNTSVLTLSPGSANDNTYTVHYFVTVTVDANSLHFCTAALVVAIDTNDGGGWVERATFTYNAAPLSGPPPYSAATTTISHEQHAVVVSGLASGTQIRLRAKSFSVSNGGTGSFGIRGGDGAGTNPETYDGATYTTASDTTESAIPAAGDQVQWTAQEVA